MKADPDAPTPHAPGAAPHDDRKPPGAPSEHKPTPNDGGNTPVSQERAAKERRGGLGGLAWGFIVLLWGYTIFKLGVFWHRYDDYSYGWFVPLLCLCLFWERWKRRPRRDPVRAASGTFLTLAFCAFALLPAALFLTVITHGRFAAWLLALSTVAITVITLYFIGGRSYARFFIFPVLFLLIAVPWPSKVQFPLTGKLASLNAGISARIANHLGIPAVRNGVIIETGSGPVGVDEACSGIRSFQASLMVSLFLGELFRFGFVRRVLLLCGGVGIAFFCNVIRTTYLVRTSDLRGMDAVNLYHDRAGFTILGVTLLGLLALAWLLSRMGQRSESGNKAGLGSEQLELKKQHSTVQINPADGLPPVAPAGRLRLGLIMVTAWVICVEAGISFWFGASGKPKLLQSTWDIQLPKQNRDFRILPIDKRIYIGLRFDEGVAAEWRDGAGRPWKLYYFRWLPAANNYEAVSADAQQWGHGEFCLVRAGMIPQANLGVQFLDVGGVEIAVGMKRFLSRGRTFHLFSAHWKAGLSGKESFPELSPRGFGIGLVIHALKTRDRGRGEQRVIQAGVWEMDSDEEAKAMFKQYLEQMIVK